jgi:hypothetical protein
MHDAQSVSIQRVQASASVTGSEGGRVTGAGGGVHVRGDARSDNSVGVDNNSEESAATAPVRALANGKFFLSYTRIEYLPK